ncbi:MAG: dihydrodipicolinate synthase family protein [Alphaproteobacteria bacterium]|nr:dihydrodipicolinate synthase family protein [Alphaproteobacteria bacterium]
MIENPNFAGVIAPVLTPFGEDGEPDPARFVEHAEWLLDEGGCTGLAPFGTTSEANSLGNDERMDMLEDLVEAGVDPAVLMPGTGTCSLADTVTLTQHAVDIGCAGVLMLPPFYYKAPSDDGLFQYFSEVIDEVDDDRLRVYLYHIPPVSQVGFSLDLIDRLRKEFPDIVVGLKDSSGDWSNMKAILERFPDFELFPGSELFLLDGLRAGAVGTISATANINGAMMRRLYDDWSGANADEIQGEISAIRKALQAYPMIPVLKAIVAHYRNDEPWAVLRAPNMALDPAAGRRAVKELADQYGFTLDLAATV